MEADPDFDLDLDLDVDPQKLFEALESAETDRVNDAIDAVDGLEMDEKAAVLAECFEPCLELYESSTDGYQRQAIVRFLRASDPQYGIIEAYGEPGLADRIRDHLPIEGEDDYRMQLLEFALTAIRDDDGRVRQATQKIFHDSCLALEARGDRTAIETLSERLDELATEHSGTKREHIVSSRDRIGRRLL